MQDKDSRCAVEPMPLLSSDQLKRELSYRTALAIVRNMAAVGLVSRGEFVRIQPILAKKFSPVWGGLYQNNG